MGREQEDVSPSIDSSRKGGGAAVALHAPLIDVPPGLRTRARREPAALAVRRPTDDTDLPRDAAAVDGSSAGRTAEPVDSGC